MQAIHSRHNKGAIRRPPIVVVMGHIDHGKSTLLDYIRKTNVVAGEAGGITQHMGAYEAEHIAEDGSKHKITFIDTPGHEAFCTIRERGAKAADIAILIVSAEDGVKPQTIEAYKAIKSQNIPYIVAISKIDKPNADIDRTKQSLGENEIYVEGWGGDVPCVAISSTTGQGVSELMEMIVLISEMNEVKVNADIYATGLVIESELDKKSGIRATILVKDGTLHTGNFIVSGQAFAPMRFLQDFKGDKIDSATPAMPVLVFGWNEVPACGMDFSTVDTKKQAEKMIEEFKSKARKNMPLPAIPVKKVDGEIQEEIKKPALYLIVKADTVGSLEGVKHELMKVKHDKVDMRIVSEGIGNICENDIKLAQANANTIVIGFHVEPDSKVKAIIERNPINIKTFLIIYELIEMVKNSLLAMVPKEYKEEVSGTVKILAVFSKDKDRQVIGGKVESGIIASGNEVKITRRGNEIGRGKVRELQEKKLRVSEVAEGHEFGVLVEAKMEIAVGDRLEAVKMVEVKS